MDQNHLNRYTLRNTLPRAALFMLPLFVSTIGGVAFAAHNQEQDSRQAERVVEQLQEKRGPPSIIIEQQNQIQQHQDDADFAWEVALPTLASIDSVLLLGAAGVATALLRRRGQQSGAPEA